MEEDGFTIVESSKAVKRRNLGLDDEAKANVATSKPRAGRKKKKKQKNQPIPSLYKNVKS